MSLASAVSFGYYFGYPISAEEKELHRAAEELSTYSDNRPLEALTQAQETIADLREIKPTYGELSQINKDLGYERGLRNISTLEEEVLGVREQLPLTVERTVYQPVFHSIAYKMNVLYKRETPDNLYVGIGGTALICAGVFFWVGFSLFPNASSSSTNRNTGAGP